MKFNKRKYKKENKIEQTREIKRGTEKVNLNCDFLYTIDTTQLIKWGAVEKQKFKSFLLKIFFRLAFG